MAWEWVAPLAAASTGVTGVYFTWRAGKQARDHAETVLINQLANSRLLAIDTRQQQRLETAYLQLLIEAERVGNWASVAYPMVETNPPQPEPDLPSLDEQAKTASLVNAFGSLKVKARLEEWRQIALRMTLQARRINMTASGTEHNIDARTKFYELQPHEREARIALGTQVSNELQAAYQLVPIEDPNVFPWRVGQDD